MSKFSPGPVPPAPVAAPLVAPLAAPAGAAPAISVGQPRPIVRVEPVLVLYTIGCWALALCGLAAQTNDLTTHLFHTKAYLYYLGFPVAMIAFVFCGSALRGLNTNIGKAWMGFGVWLVMACPFSVWRGGSLDLIKPYLMRHLLLFFLICAFAVNLRYVRFLMHAMIFGSFLVLITCMIYGSDADGRFRIVGSSYFDSANDLGIELIVDIGFFAFLLFKKFLPLRVLGGIAIIMSSLYILRTGSRGTFVASVILLAIAFFLAKNKLMMVMFLIPIALCIPLVKRDSLERLVMIYAKPEAATMETDVEGAAVLSQLSRQQLLRLSLEMTAKHPLFGVGPGQFIEATSGADRKRGKHSSALGTHNSYTQISSECGVLALVLFAGALVVSLRKVWRLYKLTRGLPEFREVSGLAYSLVLSITGFCAVSMFHHVGYTPYACVLTGMAVTLSIASEEAVSKIEPEQWRPAVASPVFTARAHPVPARQGYLS